MSSVLPTDIDPRLEPMPPGDAGNRLDSYRLVVGKPASGNQDGRVRLMLHRRPNPEGCPVLLLHGASAGSDTFLTPRPRPGAACQNLVEYLVGRGFEPWLLDWRGSKYVAEQLLKSAATQPPADVLFNFDAAAAQDIKAAIDVMIQVRGQEIQGRIGAVGFCMGGAILAQALLDDLPGVSDQLSHVVLMSLGLFYSMNLYGRLKAESHLLERVVSQDGARRCLDPRIASVPDRLRAAWPKSLEELYKVWRRPYGDARINADRLSDSDRSARAMFNRISFMFGEPYLGAKVVPEVQETTLTLEIADSQGGPLPIEVLVRQLGTLEADGRLAYSFTGNGARQPMVLYRHRGEFRVGQELFAEGQPVGRVAAEPVRNPPLLPELFGAIALHLLIHGANNLRAGQATRFDANPAKAPVPHIDGRDRPYAGFDRPRWITLISGGLNRLWHRDSIDRMAAWLGRNPGVGRQRFTKWILPDFGHQDLLWGRDSMTKVFPLIEAGLREKGKKC